MFVTEALTVSVRPAVAASPLWRATFADRQLCLACLAEAADRRRRLAEREGFTVDRLQQMLSTAATGGVQVEIREYIAA